MGRHLFGGVEGAGVHTGVPKGCGQSHPQQRLPDLGISLLYQSGCYCCKRQIPILNHLSKGGNLLEGYMEALCSHCIERKIDKPINKELIGGLFLPSSFLFPPSHCFPSSLPSSSFPFWQNQDLRKTNLPSTLTFVSVRAPAGSTWHSHAG